MPSGIDPYVLGAQTRSCFHLWSGLGTNDMPRGADPLCLVHKQDRVFTYGLQLE